MAHLINWFEIPAADLKRAAAFYGKVFEGDVFIQDFNGLKMGFLPGASNEEVGGAVVEHKDYKPSPTDGALIYLNGGSDLKPMLDRAISAGAEQLMGKTQISPEIGYMALILDSEGNRIAIHSPT